MSTEPFNDEEKTDILRFLDYPDLEAMASSIHLGYPAASEPMWLVMDTMGRITPTARARVRDHLCELRCIEKQLSDARSRLKVERIGDVTMNFGERTALREEFGQWKKKLADLLGVVPNPYAQANTGSPLNARVVS